MKSPDAMKRGSKDTPLPSWNLESVYPSPKDWEDDFSKLAGMAETSKAFRGHLADSADTLRRAYESQDAFSRLLDKLFVYATMKSDENTRLSENSARVNRIRQKWSELAPCFAWFEPELMAIPQKTIDAYLLAPELAFYRRSLEESLRGKAHVLSEPEERLLGTLADVLAAPGATFAVFNDGDLSFGRVKNGEGRSVPLTHGTYHVLMEDADRRVRERAFRKLYGTYKKFRNTLASTLNATVQRHVLGARIRQYSSALDMALFGDNIPEEVYTQLLEAVHLRIPFLKEYLETRRRALSVERLEMWDFYNPLLPACNLSFTWKEAVDLVREALKPLGREYCQDLENAFSQRWIDVPERPGKRSGGYSGGCYDTHPFILLNFHGTLNDVFTLAHELGHSMHSLYSRRTQQFHYSDYKIFVAEVASTTNEILLAEHLLKKTSKPEIRQYLLCHLADEIRCTIYRQTMFAEFELKIHQLAARQTPLTADLLDDEYYALNELYHGLRANRLIALEWARIPHFYYNFYVYKYATGMSAAIQLANRILKEGENALEDYMGFLKAGCSRDVLDIMKGAGVDLATPAPVVAALDYFGSIVHQLDIP